MLATRLVLLFPLLLAFGCKQELPRQVDTPPAFGTIQALDVVDGEKRLIYTETEDPHQKNWGLATSYYVTLDGHKYQVSWNEAEKFKQLKVGDKVNLHPTEYITCVGESDLKPSCTRLMKIYRTERRLDPIRLTP